MADTPQRGPTRISAIPHIHSLSFSYNIMQSEHDDKRSLEEHSKYGAAHIDHEPQSSTLVQDEALKVLAYARDQPPITPEEERALLRKVDLRVIPMLFITTGLQFADKSR